MGDISSIYHLQLILSPTMYPYPYIYNQIERLVVAELAGVLYIKRVNIVQIDQIDWH
jgi:hypothetical protein